MPIMKAKAADTPSDSRNTQIAAMAVLAESQLREAGVRVTQARVNVLGALLETRSAASHQDIRISRIASPAWTASRSIARSIA
ncbi:MAG: hypothetical protein GAK35_02789 [Herbaspirillum frisingense]|uniref:Uncharacterized protein n=1 Tax=Herbaspirillum frisingense TaxID=92645 RepID=A0A7V8JTG1_9BURK|nr:MAG: hypothetical protein GAK35_02789 [Herbaspirillum frisingense]